MTSLERNFIENNVEKGLFQPGDKVLVAVSGGIDSVVLSHLFAKHHQHSFSIAHCNFGLRGAESDQEEDFVKALAEKYSCKFYVVHFNTEQHATENKISVQMAARDLRYEWFQEIAEKHDYQSIAIAHNSDDVVETVLLNLARGTGLKGLMGIAPKAGNIIRPLLFASRTDIEYYVRDQELKYCEDSSNQSVKYKRNLIRHKIIPLLKKINPSFSQTILQETKIFSAIYESFQALLQSVKAKLITVEGERIKLSLSVMSQEINSPELLFEILKEFGFNLDQSRDILLAADSISGKKFYSETHVILKDREYLIIEPLRKVGEAARYTITPEMRDISIPLKMSFRTFKKDANFSISRDPQKVTFDGDKISYPLLLRKWEKGDSFQPLGLNGRKKLSDFFVDRKIDLLEKERTWVLCAGNRIIWIVGLQIDDRFKISESTQNILEIELKG